MIRSSMCLVGGLVLLSSPVWAEECVKEKLQIQALLQQNAQLSVATAQQQFQRAKDEQARLEAIEKNGTGTKSEPAAGKPAAGSVK